MKLRIRRIEKAQDFVALAPIWAQLAKDSGQLSPFLSYDWFWCCWHGVVPHRRPEILVIEESAVPVAIVPLMHWRGRVRGLPVRYVGFLECPNTPWVDILTVGEHDRVLDTLLDHLASRSDWDTAWLRKLPAASPSLAALEKSLAERLPWHRTGHLLYPYIAIDGSWDRFVEAKNPSCKEFYRKIQAQLKRAGSVSLEEHRTVDLQSPFMREALQVMHRSSQTEGGVATTAMPRTLEFFRELTRRASKNDWLSLWSLRLNGQIICIEYQLRSNGTFQALSAWEDPAYRELLSGSALSLVILRSLFECAGVHEYIMRPRVRGDRLLWSTAYHDAVHLKVYRPGIYSRLLYELETMVGLKAH